MNILFLNIIIAIIWFGLSSSQSLTTLFFGFIIGFVLLTIAGPLFNTKSYTFKTIAFLKFLVAFLKEFILSNINVITIILFRSNDELNPTIVKYEVPDLKPHQTLILSHCITLTPGTTSIDITDDYKTIIIHSIDTENEQQLINDIDNGLKKPIKDFTQ